MQLPAALSPAPVSPMPANGNAVLATAAGTST